MNETTTTPTASYDAGSQIRPLSVRMSDDVRAQLDIIAQLNDRSVTEEMRLAIKHWIQKSKADPMVLERAATVRAEIERDAATKRGAIAAIFDAPVAKKPSQAATKAASAAQRSTVRPDRV